MTKIYITLCLFSLPILLNAQCKCPILPDDQTDKTVVTVSTVSELQTALSDCNSAGGNYTILLEDGEYQLTQNLLYINQGMRHLTIRSASGNRDAVIIRGQGPGGNLGYIFNVAASHFTAADMTIGWVSNHPIQIHAEHDADSCLIQNVRFVDAKEQMLKVSGSSSPIFSDGGVVQCCLFEFPEGVAYQYYTGGIDAHRAKNWEVRNNTFKHIRSPDASLAEHAIHFWSGSENTLVENNLIIDCDRGIGFGLGSSPHFGGLIRNNFVHTSRDVGIGLETSADTKVYNNTVITENYFNSIEYRFEETQNVHIANNLTNETVASRNGGSGLIESNFETSDMSIFTDAPNHDYHLSGNFADITNAGIELFEIEKDYDCHSRTTGGVPDIGADEFESVSNSNSVISESEIFILPNPTSGKFSVFGDELTGAELWSYDGLPLLNKTTETGQIGFDISFFRRGAYVLILKYSDSILVKKVIKV